MKKLFVVLHHSDDPTQGAQFAKIDESHRRRGFPLGSMGYYVGYHWFVGFDGTEKQARQEDEVGAHCDAKLMNYVGIGVCLAGDFTKFSPSPVQIKHLSDLVKDIQNRWGIPNDSILLHRECKPTACPGTNLRELIMQYRRQNEAPLSDVAPGLTAMAARSYARRLQRLTSQSHSA